MVTSELMDVVVGGCRGGWIASKLILDEATESVRGSLPIRSASCLAAVGVMFG